MGLCAQVGEGRLLYWKRHHQSEIHSNKETSKPFISQLTLTQGSSYLRNGFQQHKTDRGLKRGLLLERK